MNRHAGIGTAAIAVLLPLAGCAINAPRDAEAAQALTAESPRCDYATGSRIRPRPEQACAPNQQVRTFSKEEMDSTGETDIGSALRRLDPAFR